MSGKISAEELMQKCLSSMSSVNLPECLRTQKLPFYEKLAIYLQKLSFWNSKMNLVGAQSWEDILIRLCYDSWYLADLIDTLELATDDAVWDFGAGAGLPGIPLRLLWNKGTYTMVEAREKRALFLQTIIAQLGIQNTSVFRGRVENFMGDSAQCRLMISRAFMPWPKLLDLMQDHVVANGYVIIMAISPAPEVISTFWTLQTCTHYTIVDEVRYLWVLRRKA